jgi:hypothetical protein
LQFILIRENILFKNNNKFTLKYDKRVLEFMLTTHILIYLQIIDFEKKLEHNLLILLFISYKS